MLERRSSNSMIPPRIRALAKIIHDADLTPWFDPVVIPAAAAGSSMSSTASERRKISRSLSTRSMAHYAFDDENLEALIALLQDGVEISSYERKQFDAAFWEYNQHLRSVDMNIVNASVLCPLLQLTLRIDSECTFAGLSFGSLLPTVRELHETAVTNIMVETTPSFTLYLQTYIAILQHSLGELLKTVMGGGGGDATDSGTLKGVESPTSRDRKKGEIATWNSKLALHVMHFKWFLAATRSQAGESFAALGIGTRRNVDRSGGANVGVVGKVAGAVLLDHFDAYQHITDISMRDLWCKTIGRHVPVCSVAQFLPALALFAEEARPWMLRVLNIYDCGVVSVFSLVRLVAIWGPLLLTDRNMLRDLHKGMFCLDHTVDACEKDLAETGEPGDYKITVGLELASVGVSVVTSSRRVQTIVASKESGAWILHGVSHEDFATISDAMTQFPQLFSRPCGTTAAKRSLSDPQQAAESAAAAAAAATVAASSVVDEDGAFSAFHRACFHNNQQYVRTLLRRGAGVQVNVAVRDPEIATLFQWTPLLAAVNNPNGDPEVIVEQLIEHGADPGTCDEATCTALYYAISNGYALTVRILKAASPSLGSSRSTDPLLLALGAHAFHASDLDVLRLTYSLPSSAVIAELLPYVRSWKLIRLSIAILEGKLANEELTSSSGICEDAAWKLHFAFPLLTEVERKNRDAAIAEHSALVRLPENKFEMMEVLRILRAHSFFLSAQVHFGLIPLS